MIDLRYTARALIDELHPALRRMDADADIRGSTAKRIDALLAAMPERCVLTGKTIAALPLSPDQRAYLITSQWRRTLAMGSHEPLADVLNKAMQPSGGVVQNVPYWLNSTAAVTAVDEPSQSSREIVIWCNKQTRSTRGGQRQIRLSALTADKIVGSAWGPNEVALKLALVPPPECLVAWSLLSFGKDMWGPGWLAMDRYTNETLALHELPASFLDVIVSQLSTDACEEALRTTALEFVATVDTLRRERMGYDEGDILARIKDWQESGPKRVEAADRQIINHLARALEGE
jgi:hypothetical protein